ncbi:hypothetical protein EI94DRAFT_1769986 [Lactarius quietus]|nr:hypothetical protein EI94DRAFT_1769986 [Lactarius quietus]
MTVIDRSGIHEIGISWCCCPGAAERDLQLMMAGLLLATFCKPKTAFTFRVLEDFHLDNLECKTTPSQFFSHLRRLTNDEFPNTVPDRYREPLRKPGSMAVFCALCAQPGINLPENWREYENSDILFMRGFMMDRNFQAEHMKMRNPENDVPLSEGAGFMVSQKPYELHLQSALERRQIPTCLARYSPSFIKGRRQIDGETIETLWAPLNEITRSTREMSMSHRREVIDVHMNDSN